MDEIRPINRRTVLQRGLGFLAAALGLEVIDPRARAQAEILATPPGEVPEIQSTTQAGKVLRFYAARWQAHPQGHKSGQLPSLSDRMDRQGELFDTFTKRKAGEFYATRFCPAASFGGPSSSGAGIELHTFRLGADTLFGMGSSSAQPSSPQLHAIVGGTGRFAGIKGSYLVKQDSVRGNGDVAEIVLTIIN
jgi:hypothetical protein